ncbi:MAG: hypothetical protein U0354_05000 [Candidatus Sericytochromatia bacterium]
MKKLNLILVTFISFSLSSIAISEAKTKVKSNKKAQGIAVTSALGKNLDVENPDSQKKKSGTGNVFYDFANDQTKKTNTTPVTPKATPIPVVTTGGGTGAINKDTVRKNQIKEAHMSLGMKYLGDKELDNALGEFKKAQAVVDDSVVKRWIHIVNNKKKIDEVNKKIEEINSSKK